MMSNRIFLIISVIIKNGENMNHASFDDVEKNSLIMIAIIKKRENVNV